MITKKQIIEDFKSIRYYYSMKDVFDRNSDKVRPKTTEELVKKYSEIMENAPARLYVVYVGLYVENNTQTSLAEDWGYSRDYIRNINQRLINYVRSVMK